MTCTVKRLDHGELNVPLSKRGNIDAQIDRYKAEASRELRRKASQQAAERRELVAQAKALLAEALATDAGRAKVQGMADRAGMTLAAAKKKLASMSYWEPRMVIWAFSSDQPEGEA